MAVQDKEKTDTNLTQADLPLMIFFAVNNGSRFWKEQKLFCAIYRKSEGSDSILCQFLPVFGT